MTGEKTTDRDEVKSNGTVNHQIRRQGISSFYAWKNPG